jgi:hypothetical protein
LEREYLFQYRHYDQIYASINEYRNLYYRNEFPVTLDARNSLNPNYATDWVTQHSILTFAWRLQNPNGSTHSTGNNPTFTMPALNPTVGAQRYRITLDVTNNGAVPVPTPPNVFERITFQF